jgi:large subunit ribosomal protein L17
MNTIIHTIAPRYAERNGGYTRIVKIGSRKNDGSEMAIIEFVQ